MSSQAILLYRSAHDSVAGRYPRPSRPRAHVLPRRLGMRYASGLCVRGAHGGPMAKCASPREQLVLDRSSEVELRYGLASQSRGLAEVYAVTFRPN